MAKADSDFAPVSLTVLQTVSVSVPSCLPISTLWWPGLKASYLAPALDAPTLLVFLAYKRIALSTFALSGPRELITVVVETTGLVEGFLVFVHFLLFN